MHSAINGEWRLAETAPEDTDGDTAVLAEDVFECGTIGVDGYGVVDVVACAADNHLTAGTRQGYTGYDGVADEVLECLPLLICSAAEDEIYYSVEIQLFHYPCRHRQR